MINGYIYAVIILSAYILAFCIKRVFYLRLYCANFCFKLLYPPGVKIWIASTLIISVNVVLVIFPLVEDMAIALHERTSQILSVNLISVVLLGCRYNIISELFGVPQPHLLWAHVIFGALIVFQIYFMIALRFVRLAQSNNLSNVPKI